MQSLPGAPSRTLKLRFILALAPLTVVAPALVAQDSAAVAGVAVDTAPAPKKKGGLFGKLKKVAADKTVQSVAKVAACTVVPGGQYVAGAIDAASSNSATGAAGGAAAAATGSSCYGGAMGGMTNAAAGGVPVPTGGPTNLQGLMTGASMAAVLPGATLPSGGGMGMYKMPKDQQKQMLQAYRQAMTQMGTPKDKQDRFLELLEQMLNGKGGDPEALQKAYAEVFAGYTSDTGNGENEP